MIVINLHELIKLIPELTNLFLPGFVFMSIYGWFKNKDIDNSTVIIWSLFISTLIKTFYSLTHSFVFTTYNFNEYLKILIYVITGTVLPFIVFFIQNSKLISSVLFKTANKSINSDIFDDIIDYRKKTMLRIYMKNSNIFYMGTFKFREEKGLDSYIVLIDYASLDKSTNEIIFKPDDDELKSTVVINLRDIERIELTYEDDSEVWKRLSGENDNPDDTDSNI